MTQLIQTGASPGLVILNDPANLGTVVASYGIWTGAMVIAGAGAFAGGTGGCNFSPTGGETGGTGQVIFVALDGGGAIIGNLDCQTVSYDPATGPSTGDPWATALPGAYAAGLAGNILGNLAGGSAAALLDLPNAVDVGVTVRQALTIMSAMLAGRHQTSGPTAVYKNWANTKNRAIVSLGAGGQRTNVVYDFS